jgi:hypothetical protein
MSSFTTYAKQYFNKIPSNEKDKLAKIENINISNNIYVINQINPVNYTDNTMKIVLKNNKHPANEAVNMKTDFLLKDKTGMRMDAYGIPIIKGSKNHKISFSDNFTNKKLIQNVKIESLKKYNSEVVIKENSKAKRNNSCCLVF